MARRILFGRINNAGPQRGWESLPNRQQTSAAATEDLREVEFLRDGGNDVVIAGEGGAEGVAVLVGASR